MNPGTRSTTRDLITAYIAAIRWFIPLEMRKDAKTLTRAQNVINAVVMAAFSGPFYAYTYHALGFTVAGKVILTNCICMFLAPFLMRLTGSIVVGREVFLCAVFFNFSWLTYAMGGVSAPTAGWMVVPPMVAMFLGGFGTAMFWLGLTCVTVVFIYALPMLGIPLPEHPIEEMRLLFLLCDFGLYLVIVLFVMLFEVTRTEGFVKLQHALDFLHAAAVRDEATGGYRRGHTDRLLEEERTNAIDTDTRFSLCLLEIDGFRPINGTHGQAGGDLVLREVTQCVRKHLREPDSFGRYGAAQLLLILPRTAQDEALALAERVRACVERLRFASLSPELAVTVSIGVAELRAGEAIGQTVARADEALHQARSGARNRVRAYDEVLVPAAPADDAAAALFDSTRIDALTGLLDRRVLRDRLGHAMARALRNARPVALMLVNVNRLGEINAAYGIEGGDAVLAQAAALLRASLHVADTVVRYSGDQFIVILEDLRGGEDARQAAEKILDRFALPLPVGERECAVTLAIGIALFPAPSCDMDKLLERTTAAMTRARNLGGNNVQLHGADPASVPDERLALKNDLREALASQQLRLDYQPQVDLASGQVVGVEALLRWDHPQLGRLDAARFLPLAEETGLAVPIGEWTLRAACRQNAAWRKEGLPALRTALSLSARQLAHPGMADIVLAIARETGVDPRCLDLQVSAPTLSRNSTADRELLERLRRAGTRICIDGFGVDGAGLDWLAELPTDILKLDARLVARLGQPEQDERAWALAESVIHMAHRLQLGVVAVAVDTRAQLADLKAMGCDAAQGDHLHPAAGPEIVAQLLAPATCPTP